LTNPLPTIAHVDAESGFSGGEAQVFLLMEGLRARGWGGVLVCPPGSAAERVARERGFEVRTVAMRNDVDLPAVRALARVLREGGAALAHLHTGRAHWLGGLAARRARLPALATRRMDKPLRSRRRARSLYERLAARTAAISGTVERQLLEAGVPRERVVRIDSAVDPARLAPSRARAALRAELGVAPDRVVVLVLGQLVERKGQDLALEALALRRAAGDDLTLWLAGDGPAREALQRRAVELGLGETARFLGRREDVPDLLAACDLVATPSRAEGLGVAALEAMAAARPVVAARVGGLAESVVHERTGLLVAPGDVGALAEALGRLARDAALRERLGRAGPGRLSEGYLAEQMVAAYDALYRRVLGMPSETEPAPAPAAGAAPPRPGLSACIISFQEADRIEACIDSLSFCDEVVVVDSHSTDRTRELAAAKGARVIERDWPGHVKQKEFTIRAATHDWVLCVDSDERISPRLREEIVALREQGFPGAPGWTMPRLSSYLGAWVRHGSWYPDRQLRLFDRRRGRWGGHDPHDRVELEGRPGRLRGDLLHHPYRDMSEHLATIDKYTTIMAQGMLERGKRARAIDLVTHPLARFVRFYLVKGGWRLGWRGLLLACLGFHYGQLKYAKLLALQADTRPPATPGA
jgi:glycosyltransferase involved in cell wall biosynthesis